MGVPWGKAIEVQVMIGVETPNYTSEGDIFSIWGATMTPDRPHPAGWARCLPSEARTKGAGEWNHYRIECKDGRITLANNGKIVSGAFDCNPRRGYICLEAEGTPIDFRNLRIKELSARPLATAANDATGFTPLFNGVNLQGWTLPVNRLTTGRPSTAASRQRPGRRPLDRRRTGRLRPSLRLAMDGGVAGPT